eukprot:symbB.v1.2.032242.t2/scaffold3784.1/size51792/3
MRALGDALSCPCARKATGCIPFSCAETELHQRELSRRVGMDSTQNTSRCYLGKSSTIGRSADGSLLAEHLRANTSDVSTEKSTTRHEHSHQIDLSSYLKEEGVKDLEDPITSWEVHDVPKGYPPNMLLPPDRKLHEKHMKKLNKFLKRTEKLPSTLTDSVEEKRERSHFQVSLGISL